MLGGLYGDLPPPSEEDDKKTATTKAWSSSTKLAPQTLRKPHIIPPPPTTLRPKPTTKHPLPDTLVISQPTFQQPALVGVTATVLEEYDPSRPNDYEEYKKEKRRRAREVEVRRELEERERREKEKEKERERDRERDVEISGEEAWRRRAAMSEAREGEREEEVGFSMGGGGMTAAQRMMAKMGWKEGQGLGRQEQGITTPLMAKKTDRRAGVIVNASDAKQQQQQQQQQQMLDKKVKSVNFNGPPTRVLLLRNMVGPGEVDDDLEDEVASECAKYGTVTRVLIFEITEHNFPSDEAVRIFVQFERPEEATKAYADLDKRFFGGRIVQASFYDVERFSKNDLAPRPGEVPGF